MSWEEVLDQYGVLIEWKIEEFFSEALNRANVYHPFTAEVYDGLMEFVLRKGKRLASSSTLLAS